MNVTLKPVCEGASFAVFALARGSECPLMDFLNELAAAESATFQRVMRSLERAAATGPMKNPDICKSLGQKRWEFKIGWVRVPFFYDEGKVVLCTHGFRKQSQKTPKAELKTVDGWMELYFRAKAENKLIIEA